MLPVRAADLNGVNFASEESNECGEELFECGNEDVICYVLERQYAGSIDNVG